MQLLKTHRNKSVICLVTLLVLCASTVQAQYDLGGVDLTTNNITDGAYAGGIINSDGAGGEAADAVLRITGPTNGFTYAGVLGNVGGAFSNFKLVFDVNRNDHTYITPTGNANYHTLGTEIVQGILVIQTEAALGTGPLTINGGALAFGTNYGNSNFNRDIEIGPNNAVLRKGWNGDTTTINGVIHGVGNLYFGRDNGTFVLTKQNTYSGNTVMGYTGLYAYNAGGVVVKLGIDNALPNTNLEVDGSGTFEMNGFNQTISTLTGAGTIRNESDHLVGDTATPMRSTLTVSDGTFNGRITSNSNTRNITVVKNTAGVLSFGGATGNFDNSRLEVNEGTVEFRKTGGTAFSQVRLEAGTTMKVGAGNQQIGDLGGTGVIISTGDVPADQTATLTITGNFDGFTTVGASGSFGVSGGTQNDFRLVISGGGKGLRENNTYQRSAMVSYHTGGTIVETTGLTSISSFNLFGNDLTIRNAAIIGIQGHENGSATINLTYGSETDQTPLKVEGQGGGFRMASNSTLNIAKPIIGSGDFVLAADSNSRLTLSSPDNDYKGRTIIGSPYLSWNNDSERAILTLAATGSLPKGTELVFGQQRSSNNSGADNPYMLELNGNDVTLSKITGGKGRINNLGGTQATVSLNSDTDWNMADVQFVGDILLKKTGAGTATVHSSMYSVRELEISGGKLLVNTDAGAPAGKTIHVTGNSGMVADTFQNWGRVFVAGGSTDNTTFRGVTAAPDFFVRSMSDVADKAYEEKLSHNSGLWRNQSTYVYTLEFEITADATPIQFFKNFDDWGLVTITPTDNGTLGTPEVLVDSGTHNQYIITEAKTFDRGTYLLEVRLGQGGGGVGKTLAAADLGLGIYVGGDIAPVSTTDGNLAALLNNMNKFSALTLDDNGNLAFGPNSPIKSLTENRTIATNFDIDGGATFTLSGNGMGNIAFTGTASGDGVLRIEAGTTNFRLESANTHKGGTEFTDEITVANSAAFGNGGSIRPDGRTTMVLDLASGNITNAMMIGSGSSLELKATDANAGLFTGSIGGSGQLVFDLDAIDSANPLFILDSLSTLDLSDGLEFAIIAANPRSLDGITFDLIAAENVDLGGQSMEDILGSLFNFGLAGGNIWDFGYDNNNFWVTFDANKVPEPGTWTLLLLGVLGVFVARRRKA